MLDDSNPNGRPNSDVVKPYLIGRDLNGKRQERWLIDFGAMSESDARLYNLPYQHCLTVVKPTRTNSRERRLREQWWLHSRNRVELRESIAPLTRYIGTSEVSKHRYFQYIHGDVTSDKTVTIFAREDDYFLGILESRFHKVWTAAVGTQLESRPRFHIISECFRNSPFQHRRSCPARNGSAGRAPSGPRSDDYFLGILESRFHKVWTAAVGTQLESRPRYIISECFEKFPFPTPTESQRETVAQAARRLDEQRRNAHLCRPNGTYRRSMTALYNENPPWLQTAHAELDAAVADAYGWSSDLADDEILRRLVRLNVSGGAGRP